MQINQETDVFVVIDVQNDFTLPSGALYVKDGFEVVKPIASVCLKFNNLFFTQDSHPVGHKSFASSHDGKKPFDIVEMYRWRQKPYLQTLWPDHCIQGSIGGEIVSELWPERDRAKAIIRKGTNPLVDSYSAFMENYGPTLKRATTGFAGMLHDLGIRRVFFAGLARDYCVRFSAEDAVAEGFKSFIIDNLTKSVDSSPEATAKTTTALSEAGVKMINYSDVE